MTHEATTPANDPRALNATRAIQAGDLDTLSALLEAEPWLATARLGDDDCYRTLLHVVTDWPGHFPRGPEVVGLLVRAGADVSAPSSFEHHSETPLHWAASSDDVAVLDALLDAGADIEAPGAVLGGGTPLADACGFGNWAAARRLVERGAATRLKDAAALGRLDLMGEHLDAATPSDSDLTQALWSACHAGQLDAARWLHELGADADWVGWDGLTPLAVAEAGGFTDVADWLREVSGR
jgi:ankyrin repeat protein